MKNQTAARRSPDLSPQAAAEFAEIRRIMREAEEERKAAAAAADKRAAEYAAEAAEFMPPKPPNAPPKPINAALRLTPDWTNSPAI